MGKRILNEQYKGKEEEEELLTTTSKPNIERLSTLLSQLAAFWTSSKLRSLFLLSELLPSKWCRLSLAMGRDLKLCIKAIMLCHIHFIILRSKDVL